MKRTWLTDSRLRRGQSGSRPRVLAAASPQAPAEVLDGEMEINLVPRRGPVASQ